MPGGVGIERKNDALGQTLDQVDLGFGQGGAHRSDDIAKAKLMRGDDVHVAFDDDYLIFIADSVSGEHKPVE